MRTALLLMVALLGAPGAALAQAPKPGGVLTVMQREELPQGLSILETSTIATVWPASPCFNNLVYFDPAKPTETPDSIVGELAEKWSWQDGYRNLVFFLRKDVKWHDGQPFTSRDVKFTFDLVREAPEAQGKLRLNPRKDWYANIEAIEAADPAGPGALLVVTADHGNADEMRDPTGAPVTAHSLNPVPLLLAGRCVTGRRLQDGVLADVAPTILALAGVPPWPGMTGRSLLEPV
jgi:hypothetical protein